MKDAIDLLMREHETIVTVLDALDVYARALECGDDVERTDLARFVTFVRDYVDTLHHSKEEGVLFPAMHEAGLPRDGGPVAVMLHEHEAGRALTARLDDAASTSGPWSVDERSAAGEAARSFSQLLRDHIHKENNILYPMALNAVSESAQRSVDAACQQRQQQAMRSGAVESLERLARELSARYKSSAARDA